LDSVNVLCRSHYLPVFARLGPYPRDALDRFAWGPGPGRRLFEYWGHMASLLPWRLQPFLRWRMARARDEVWPGIVRSAEQRPGLVDEVRRLVAEQGPIVAGSIEVERPAKVPGEMWNWHDGKVALEWLFAAGEVSCATRVNFERSYDLTERVVPPGVLAAPTPPDDEAHRELIRIAARAHGVATERDLRDYFRHKPRFSKPAVADLGDAGELLPVGVQGWSEPAYLWHEARLARRVRARALLSPFDSLVWERDRTERLFGFRYRIEIYVPAAKRVHGYYVLPFLLGDRLVARLDLKADRQSGVRGVQAACGEPGPEAGEVADELATALTELAAWLGLSGVAVLPRGDLAGKLAVAMQSR